MFIIKRASKRNTLHGHEKVSFCPMDINVLCLAVRNNTEKFTKDRNYLDGLILLAPSVCKEKTQ